MSEPFEFAREVVARDPMSTFLGIRLEEVREAYARIAMVLKPEYLNSLGRSHGITVSALVDQAAAIAANTVNHPTLIAELKINFLDAAHVENTLIAEASALDIRRKLSLWQIEVNTETGRRIALGQALAYHQGWKP